MRKAVIAAMLEVKQFCYIVMSYILLTVGCDITYGLRTNIGIRNLTRPLITLSVPPTWQRDFVFSSVTSPHLIHTVADTAVKRR